MQVVANCTQHFVNTANMNQSITRQKTLVCFLVKSKHLNEALKLHILQSLECLSITKLFMTTLNVLRLQVQAPL